jgi:hypothetical protein
MFQSIIGKKTASLGQSSILFVVIWRPDALPSVEVAPPMHSPEELHKAAGAFALLALTQAFPCP